VGTRPVWNAAKCWAVKGLLKLRLERVGGGIFSSQGSNDKVYKNSKGLLIYATKREAQEREPGIEV